MCSLKLPDRLVLWSEGSKVLLPYKYFQTLRGTGCSVSPQYHRIATRGLSSFLNSGRAKTKKKKKVWDSQVNFKEEMRLWDCYSDLYGMPEAFPFLPDFLSLSYCLFIIWGRVNTGIVNFQTVWWEIHYKDRKRKLNKLNLFLPGKHERENYMK